MKLILTTQQVSDHARSTMFKLSATGLVAYRKQAVVIPLLDGHNVSLQAGEHLYSSPRADQAIYYTHLEAGFPTFDVPKSWHSYAENPDYKLTVYSYIPTSLVTETINDIGICPSFFISKYL